MNSFSNYSINYSIDCASSVTGIRTTELDNIGKENRWNSLSPREQFKQWFQAIKPPDSMPMGQVWIKIFGCNNNWQNYRCYQNQSNGNISGYKCASEKENFKPISDNINDIFGEIEKLTITNNKGVVFLPNIYGLKASSEGLLGRFLLSFECDSLSKEEQKKQIIELANYGLYPYFVIDSGNKSYHIFYLIEIIERGDKDWGKWNYAQSLFALIGGDPSVANSTSNLMRAASFNRYFIENKETKELIKNDKRQSLEYLDLNITPYNINDFIEILRGFLASKGIESQSWEEWNNQKIIVLPRERILREDLDESDTLALLKSIIKDLEGVNIGENSQTYHDIRNVFWALCSFISPDIVAGFFGQAFPRARDWDGLARNYAPKEGRTLGLPAIKEHLSILIGRQWDMPDSFSLALAKIRANDFDLEQWKASKKERWKELKSLTQCEEACYRYISEMPIPSLNLVLLLNSMLGTGKTRLAILLLDLYCQNRGVIAIFSRISLGENFNAATGNRFVDIVYEKNDYYEGDNRSWLLCRFDSLLKIKEGDRKGNVILLDEIVSGLHHLLFSRTLDGQRLAVLLRFFELLKSAYGLICMDGHLPDFIVDFFRQLNLGIDIRVVKNTYDGGRPLIKFYEGSMDGDKLKKNDISGLITNMKETLKRKPIIVFGDSRKDLESLDKGFIKLGLKGFLLTSKTKQSEAKSFLKDCGKWILDHRIDYLLISPTAESGIDISGIDGYFGACYGLFYGVIPIDTIKQIMMRLRDITIPRHVWLRSHSILLDNIDSKYKKDSIYQNLFKEVNLIDASNKAEIMQSYSEFMDILPEPIWGLVEGFHNIAQHERFNYRESYLESLQMSGYKVEVCSLETDKDSNAEYKAIKKAIKETECNLIANADDRFLNKPEHVLSGHEKSDPMAIAALAKAKLADQLPLLHLSPLWGDDLIKFLLFSRPDFINARRRFWLAKELDMARLLADKRHATATLESLRNKGIAPWEMRPAYLQAKAISATGIIPLIEARVSLTHDSDPIKDLIKRASSKPIWEGLGRKPSSDPMKWICWLIRLLGYEVSGKQSRDGDRVREYSILESDFNENKPYFDLVDKLVLDRLFNQF